MSICIVAHFAYGALRGGNYGHIGGVERQTTQLARWLASRGHNVSMVTWDEGQRDGIVTDGVRVIKLCRQDDGIPGFRFFIPRWTSLNSALHRAKSDLYYHNCGEYVTGQVALWCRLHAKKFIYSIAADRDCLPLNILQSSVRERILYRYGLKNSNRIIVQTRKQKIMLKENYQLSATVLPMPCQVSEINHFREGDNQENKKPRVLWVGRLTPVKRAEWFIELAEICPDIEFDLVGPNYEDEYSHEILIRSSKVPNLTIHGAVPRDQISQFYLNSVCLCSTSETEGFPNTFLEAWSHGLPVVSTFDPDELIRERGLGGVAKDVIGLAAVLKEIISSKTTWVDCSNRSKVFFNETHSLEIAADRFEKVFQEVLNEL